MENFEKLLKVIITLENLKIKENPHWKEFNMKVLVRAFNEELSKRFPSFDFEKIKEPHKTGGFFPYKKKHEGGLKNKTATKAMKE